MYYARMDAHDEMLPEPPAIEDGHPVQPVPGSAYTTAGMNTGLQGDLSNIRHYPMTAICTGREDEPCGQVITIISFFSAWHHTGRMPGDPQ